MQKLYVLIFFFVFIWFKIKTFQPRAPASNSMQYIRRIETLRWINILTSTQMTTRENSLNLLNKSSLDEVRCKIIQWFNGIHRGTSLPFMFRIASSFDRHFQWIWCEYRWDYRRTYWRGKIWVLLWNRMRELGFCLFW